MLIEVFEGKIARMVQAEIQKVTAAKIILLYNGKSKTDRNSKQTGYSNRKPGWAPFSSDKKEVESECTFF